MLPVGGLPPYSDERMSRSGILDLLNGLPCLMTFSCCCLLRNDHHRVSFLNVLPRENPRLTRYRYYLQQKRLQMTLSGVWRTTALKVADPVKRRFIDMNAFSAFLVPPSRVMSDERLLAAFYTYHLLFSNSYEIGSAHSVLYDALPVWIWSPSVNLKSNRELDEEGGGLRMLSYTSYVLPCCLT